MHGEVQHVWVVLEHVLCAVAMVNIPVNNQDSVDTLALQCGSGSDGDVVVDAEAHRYALLRVVTRRPHHRHGIR